MFEITFDSNPPLRRTAELKASVCNRLPVTVDLGDLGFLPELQLTDRSAFAARFREGHVAVVV